MGELATCKMVVENDLRSFSMYEVLKKPLTQYVEDGDGINALAVYDEDAYPDSDLIDCSLINLIKLIATGFGRGKVPQAFRIVERMEEDRVRKEVFRFRSKHPLFVDGSPRYQNVCLISGMVFLGIPIMPYFDGVNVLAVDEEPDAYLELLRIENPDLF